MKKVTIIGAGMVGGTAARNLAQMDVVDSIILVDIKKGLAEGKAIDITQAGYLLGYNTIVEGYTGDYSATKDSDVIVITSGVPRKPGMTRESLVGTNAGIMLDIVLQCHKYSPKAIYIIVSNPVDTLTYYVQKILRDLCGRDDVTQKVIGFGGMLDEARLAYYIKCSDEMYNKTSSAGITAYKHGHVIGGHGDTTMVPVTAEMTKNDPDHNIKPNIDKLLTDDQIKEAAQNAMVGGATLTGLLGTSAWEAPAAGIAVLVRDIVTNSYNIRACSHFDNQKNVCIGQLCEISNVGVSVWHNKGFINKTVEEAYNKVAAAIAGVNECLPDLNSFKVEEL